MAEPLPDELARLFAAPDERRRDAAWARFVQDYSRILLHAANSLGDGYDAAMDRYTYILEQLRRDDFHRLRAYGEDGRGKFTTWLLVVARRLCVDHYRRRYGRAQPAADARTRDERARRRSLVELVGDEVDLERLADERAGTPESDLWTAERSRALAVAVAGLAPRDRLLLRLRFEDELSAPEIARLMDFPSPFHVYRRLNHLFGQLRGSLRRAGVADPRL